MQINRSILCVNRSLLPVNRSLLSVTRSLVRVYAGKRGGWESMQFTRSLLYVNWSLWCVYRSLLRVHRSLCVCAGRQTWRGWMDWVTQKSFWMIVMTIWVHLLKEHYKCTYRYTWICERALDAVIVMYWHICRALFVRTGLFWYVSRSLLCMHRALENIIWTYPYA